MVFPTRLAMTTTPTRPRATAIAALTISVGALHAQTASRTATSSSEETVQLSPFTVSIAGDTGYRATNTLSGSRLNSSLKDTPNVLDVLTKDFLDDIGATTLQEALAHWTNFADDLGDFDRQGVINTVFPGSQINVTFTTKGTPSCQLASTRL